MQDAIANLDRLMQFVPAPLRQIGQRTFRHELRHQPVTIIDALKSRSGAFLPLRFQETIVTAAKDFRRADRQLVHDETKPIDERTESAHHRAP